MYKWPINLRICESPQKMTDYCQEIINELGRTSSISNDVIRILPTFEMSIQTGLYILKLIEHQNVFINEEYYIKFELDRRVIYISKDSADKRPFIYWGGIDPYNGKNEKYILEELIIGPIQDPRTKVVYKDNDRCNLKMTNITFESKDPNQLLAKKHNQLQEKLSPNTTVANSIPEEAIINKEEKEALQNAIFGENKPIEAKEKELVKKVIDSISKIRELYPLEQTYLNNRSISFNDAINDQTFNWLGVNTHENKKGKTYSARFKGVTIKSGFDHPLDAARAYNEFILNNGLPYPINNIPEVLELEILGNRKNIALKEYETWELLEEAVKRIKPENEKF
jgi:hypothetical protein